MKDYSTKMMVKSALHNVKGNFPFRWDLNVYRGCAHGCVYCYALYSHDYLQIGGDFSSQIFVKENLVEVLEKELRKKTWKPEMVNLGGVTDSYQPLERSVEMMRDILKLFIKYRNPLSISTGLISHPILRFTVNSAFFSRATKNPTLRKVGGV